jgi:glyoxylase-like metal-dependent hydrolase (beta-lactamase superfamily II)
LQELPVPGRLELGADRELDLYPADGHTADGMAIWIPWARVLVCGDYLSPVEAPMVGGSTDAYLATLERLRPLVEAAKTVVPGHGHPMDSKAARELLDAHAAELRG